MAPTTAMAAGAAPPIAPAFDRPYEPHDGPARTTQRTALVVFALGALVIAGAIALALRDDDPGTASSATSGVASSVGGAATTGAPTSAAGSTADTTVPATTTPPTTSPPTTAPPTTAPPTTAPVDPAVAIADDIGRVVDAATPDQVKPKEAKDIVQRVDDAVRAADEGRADETEKKLREAAEKIDEHVAGDETRAALRSLLVDLADELGVDTDVVTEPFDGDDDDGDD